MTIFRLRPRAGLLALAAASSVAVALVAPAAGAPTAHAARTITCDVSRVADRFGATSVTSLKVSGTSCDAGKRVVRAFTRCRLANGVSGRCVRLVKGFACGEIRTNLPTEISSRVTCKKRRATVVHHYTQALA